MGRIRVECMNSSTGARRLKRSTRDIAYPAGNRATRDCGTDVCLACSPAEEVFAMSVSMQIHDALEQAGCVGRRVVRVPSA
jgi:hypothetical protein